MFNEDQEIEAGQGHTHDHDTHDDELRRRFKEKDRLIMGLHDRLRDQMTEISSTGLKLNGLTALQVR